MDLYESRKRTGQHMRHILHVVKCHKKIDTHYEFISLQVTESYLSSTTTSTYPRNAKFASC
jgi:hypothetical protein